jgi:hypothetical protein
LVMEVIAKKIRSSKIDYNYYGGTVDSANGEDTLALLDNRGEPTIFRFRADSTAQTIEVCTELCGSQSSPNNGNFVAIPARDVLITDLKFFITPATNPFSLDHAPDKYPSVTIVINLQNTIIGQTRNLVLEQTIPQRLGGL